MNEHVLSGTLPQKLLQLGLEEATHKYWGIEEPNTYVYGDSKPIDGVYHTPDLVITAVTQLSFHKGIGDHHNTLVDITALSAIGKFERRVIPPKARRLTTRNESSVKSYIKFVTRECQKHRIQQRLNRIELDTRTSLATEAQRT